MTLEPCDHVGRTGPCTEVLLAARPARIVVGCGDPNPIVDGRGITRLRRAGVRVDIGCLERECREAIRAYAVWVSEQRPLVTLKAAATLDGAIADGARRKTRRPVWITGPRAREVAHELRAAHDAVLVGAGTVRADDPQLTVRLPGREGRAAPRQPLRVVLAGRRKLPRGSRVLDDAAESLVLHAGLGAARAAARAGDAGAIGHPVAAGRGRRDDSRRVHRRRPRRSGRAVLRAAARGWRRSRRGGRGVIPGKRAAARAARGARRR